VNAREPLAPTRLARRLGTSDAVIIGLGAFLPALDDMVKEGLLTLESVEVIACRGRDMS
jgi:hypothetical protein